MSAAKPASALLLALATVAASPSPEPASGTVTSTTINRNTPGPLPMPDGNENATIIDQQGASGILVACFAGGKPRVLAHNFVIDGKDIPTGAYYVECPPPHGP